MGLLWDSREPAQRHSMATRVTAVRTLVGLLLGVAVLAVLGLLVRAASQPRVAPAAPGAVAPGAHNPAAATTGGLATTTSGPGASAAARTTPTAAPAPGPASDPCRLVTRAEAAAVLGRPVAKVQPRQGFLVRSCLFSSARGDRQVIVQLHQGPAASRAQFEMGRRPDDEPVAGVGDEAWFTPDTGLLDVRKGAARFQVGVLDVTGRPGPRRVPPSLLALARAAADRL
jgi:hypothetical protein